MADDVTARTHMASRLWRNCELALVPHTDENTNLVNRLRNRPGGNVFGGEVFENFQHSEGTNSIRCRKTTRCFTGVP